MEVKTISIQQAKRRIKDDPELSKMLVRSGWREIALDLDGDGTADVYFASETASNKIDTIAIDLSGSGEFNLYLHDFDGNGVPDTVILVNDKGEEEVVAFGGEVELGFINIGVKIANLLVAEDFMNRELGVSLADLAAYLKAYANRMLEEIEKRENAQGIDKVYYYLIDAGTFYLATTEGQQPRVRPFGAVMLAEGKLYLMTGKVKAVSKQLAENPLCEICASFNGSWIRIAGELVNDDSREMKEAMLEQNPALKSMYSADDDNMQILYLKDATATICSFTAEPEVIQF